VFELIGGWIRRHAGDDQVRAADEVSSPARLAFAALAAEPADADALPDAQAFDPVAERFNLSRNLVAGNAREREAWRYALNGDHVAVTDAGGDDADEYLAPAGLRHSALDQPKNSRRRNLDGAIRGSHVPS